MAKVLGRNLKQAHQDGIIMGSKPTKESREITHHQFIDDTILVGQAQEKEAKAFKKILQSYEKASH